MSDQRGNLWRSSNGKPNSANQGIETLQTFNLSYIGENPAQAMAKACLRPEELSEEERFILDAIYTFRVADISIMRVIQFTGDFNVEPFIETMAQIHAQEIASTIPGQAWLLQAIDSLPEILEPHAKAEIAKPSKNCRRKMSGFIRRTQKMAKEVGNARQWLLWFDFCLRPNLQVAANFRKFRRSRFLACSEHQRVNTAR